MSWKKISLFKYQEVERINAVEVYDALDKVLLTACVVFEMTEGYVIDMGAKFAAKLIVRVKRVFGNSFKARMPARIGRYRILYNVSAFTFGQYIELAFFFKQPHLNAHYILASCSRSRFRPYRTKGHKARADYFLFRSAEKTIGAVEAILAQSQAFNRQFQHLFGLDENVHTEKAQDDKFNVRYGWTYSASAIAEYCRIPLDDVYEMPAREALNHLAYLKEKAQYEVRERDRLMKQHQLQSHAG